ncbi:hypothetical protein [Candidatus Nanohalococcus occultus]|uniref:Uncharacterized protein n=1 Tax=Candidatus Nanohalococcus occultus TaxID=2978047 RepID=A0ABY8CIN5_9ARCH|nr:hypothetical protein SVXNc_0868 [Candidatus Nanohaloarchaeota archaeon SVXNc]
MKLLKTSNVSEKLDEHFEEVSAVETEEFSPEVIDGEADVRVNSGIEDCESAFLKLPERNPIFGRVLLEILEEKGITTNYPSIGFYITAKKNYLYYVLEQKDISIPETVIAASENSAKNVTRYLELPIIAKRYEENQLEESARLEDEQEAKEFAEGTDYGEDILIFQEETGDEKYKVFYANGNLISLKDKTEGWRVSDEKLQYSNLSNELEELVETTMKSIGTEYGEVILKGGKVIDVKPNPDPEVYADKSGKDAFKYIKEIYQ